MTLALLHDRHLLLIMALAAAVTLLTTLNVSARPAAIRTGRVAMAFTFMQLFFMVTRFANLFYLPLLGAYVDRAVRVGGEALQTLSHQIEWVLVGAAVGSLMSWLLLPTFVELYSRGIRSMEYRKSMLRVLTRMLTLSGWKTLFGSLRRPSLLGVRLFKLDAGIPADFLCINVLATAVWTAGALCAMLASARQPQFAATAVLLSGLVNAFAAIAFTIWVDPKAAVITDQALVVDGVAGKRPENHVTIVAVHLAAGNFLGGLLGIFVLAPGTYVIEAATQAIGHAGNSLSGSLWLVAAINAAVTLLASTAHVARVSAVLTRRVATALAVYNVFYLVTRLAQQVYAPVLGALRDHAVDTNNVASLDPAFRIVILGAAVGVAGGWLLMPTFVEIYNRAVGALDRLNSVPALFWEALQPKSWGTIVRCLRPPSLFGVRLSDLRTIPNGFLWGNVLVISIYTVGVMSAIYAGAQLSGHLARTATLLSSVVNGIATITLSLIVDPTSALITDQCVAGERPERHIYAMAVFLIGGMLLGTILSQAVFGPATWAIMGGASLLDLVFGRH